MNDQRRGAMGFGPLANLTRGGVQARAPRDLPRGRCPSLVATRYALHVDRLSEFIELML